MNIRITGSGYYVPSTIETAEDVSKKINKAKIGLYQKLEF